MFVSDDLFLTQFEALQLDPSQFDHVAHLRIAFLYIERDGVETAVHHTAHGLKAFSQKVGAPQKYHHTITEALVRLIAFRCAQMPVCNWQTFLQQNSDLVQDAYATLLQYYSSDRLQSEAARQQFLPSDKLPLEAICIQLDN